MSEAANSEVEVLQRRVAALQAEIERYRKILDSIGDGVITTDGAGRIVQLNSVAEALTGWTETEALGREVGDVFRIVQEETHTQVANLLEYVLQAGPAAGQLNHSALIACDGSVRPIAISGIPIQESSGRVAGVVLLFRDQTLERQAEVQRHEVELRFQNFFDDAPIGKSMTSPEGKLIRVNQAFAALLGRSLEEIQSLDFAAVTHPDDVAESRECVRALLAGERDTWTMEKRYQAKDGHFAWTQVTTKLHRDSRGQALYFLTHIMDINEKKRLEGVLAAVNSSLLEAQQVAHLGSWEWDPVQDAIVGSDEFYRLFDTTPQEIARFDQFTARLHPDDREFVQQDVAEALEQNRIYDTHYRIRLRDGSWRAINARGKVYRDSMGVPSRMVGTCLDITEQTRVEEELRQSQSQFRQLVESLPHLVWTCLPEGPCDFLSRQWVDYTGIPEADQLGYGWLQQLHPDDCERVKSEWSQSIGAESYFDIEFRIRRHDGTYRWFKTRAVPIKDPKGRLLKWFGSNTDIEDSKQAGDQIKRANEALVRSNAELEQFAYVASHDLQEPLRMVSSFTQLLAQRYQDKLDQDAMDFIGYAVDGANRMQKLIQDLLSFSRVTTRGQTPVHFDAHDALGEAVSNLQVVIQETMALVTNDELPWLVGDRTQVVQIFQNLIGNGIKFRRAGEPPRVRLAATRSVEQPGFWTFKVADNGIGIERRHFDRLFVIFQRLHTREEYPGTGIGLALCKRIVERHGGRIWLESEAGQGTTFCFTLPAGEPKQGGTP